MTSRRDRAIAPSMTLTILQDRDYVVILAKTAAHCQLPMQIDAWNQAQAATQALINQCERLDPDGVTLYVSCQEETSIHSFCKYEQVTSDKLAPLLALNYPPHSLPLQGVLTKALEDYLHRKAAGKTKTNGETIVVLLDGEPRDRLAIAKTIIKVTQQLEHPTELAIGLVQVGDDPIATGFFQSLDDDLQTHGAAFDIVDTVKTTDIAGQGLTQTLLNMIHD
ncbi:MAG: hypothetical protein AAFW95_12750 [Cyanobacteria bacterium J06638_6]